MNHEYPLMKSMMPFHKRKKSIVLRKQLTKNVIYKRNEKPLILFFDEIFKI